MTPPTPTFYWHDYETFGVVPRRDRPAQFAGIRTDAELNEIGDPLMIYCQPAPDYLPEPQSCLITGILPQTCLERGQREAEFAAAIERELATPGTVGVGYNSIRFDDEVTRHLFWRNLIDPYAREWKDDCGRWDVLDLVRATWALRPEGIEWPVNEDGRPSFRLEHLTVANGIAHESAHDALSDVRATIALARLIKSRQPKLFDFALKLRKKDAVTAELAQGQPGRPILHVSGMYGVDRGCMALVLPLAPHPSNKNEVIVWDLARDPDELFDLDAETIRTRLFTRAEDLPEGVERLPIKTIHINKSPFVVGNLKALPAARAERFGIDVAASVLRAEQVAGRLPELAGRWREVFARGAPEHAPDVDEDLYGGFVGNTDRRTLERLRGLTPDRLAQQVAEGRVSFDDPRLEELLFRYRARNWPESLAPHEAERWQELRRERLLEGVPGWLTLEAFAERIDALSEDADERGEALLGALYDYAEAIAPD